MNLLKLMILMFLSGCTVFPTNNIAPGYLETFKALKNAVVGFEDGTYISRELVNNIPYASMTLKIGKGPKGLMILESIRNDELTWVSADPIYLVIKSGRIIKTEGLDNDLINVVFPEIDFQKIVNQDIKPFRAFYSYSNPELNNLELEFSYSLKGKERVTILDQIFELNLVHEEVKNHKLGWKFTNKYWVDENYFIRKSNQTINPKIPFFEIEVTKKPSK